MRIKLLFLISILFCTGSYAQETVTEPDFIGGVLVLNPDNSTTPLEKATVKIKTKANSMICVDIKKRLYAFAFNTSATATDASKASRALVPLNNSSKSTKQ